MTTTVPRPKSKLRAALPLLADIVIPVAGYYLLHALGLGDFWALTISGMATGLNAVANTILRRRLDGLGLLVVIELALSIALLFVTRDPRIVLIKPSFYIAVGGGYALVSCFAGKPLVYFSAMPFATRGDPKRLTAYERAWDDSPAFRRIMRVLTVVWGVAFLVDAVVRVVIVYRFGPDQVNRSLLLSQVPSIVLLLVAIAATRLRVPSLRRIVERYLPTTG
jgi:hypothetical protein